MACELRYANTRPVDRKPPPLPPPDARRIRQRHLLALPHWVARGAWEMVKARRLLDRIKPADIARLNAAALAKTEAGRASGGQSAQVPHRDAIARVAFIIGLLGRVLPWRSDCLIQALAAQSWLTTMGIFAQIRVGVDRPADGGFGAHAWLVHHGMVVTGGNVERYAVLIGDSDALAAGSDPEADTEVAPDAVTAKRLNH